MEANESFNELPRGPDNSRQFWNAMQKLWYRRILYWALAYRGDLRWAMEAVDDVLSEAAVGIARAGNGQGIRNFDKWIYKIAYRVFQRKVAAERKQRQHEMPAGDIEIDQLASCGPDMLHESDMRYLKTLIMNSFNILSSDEQQVLVLYYWHGMKVREIAEEMGIEAKQVSRLKYDAQIKLASKLECAWRELFAPYESEEKGL